MEAEVPTVRVGATPTGLTAPLPPQPPRFFTGRMPFLPPKQQRQSTENTTVSRNACNLSSASSNMCYKAHDTMSKNV